MIMKTILRTALLLLALVLLAACGSAGETAAPTVITLEAGEFHFNAHTLELQAGQPVTIRFVNRGKIDHALVIDEWNLQTDALRTGESADLTFTPKEAGSFTFYCAIAGHPAAGMTGTINVHS
jgi:uncharacterized cupredoxin-like copper-binding protein